VRLKHDYRVPERLLANARNEDQAWAVIEDLAMTWAICPNSQRRTFLRRLTPGQRAFFALDELEAEVLNGGIHQFFWNSTGDRWPAALAGLRLIGATACAALLQKALALFPNDATRNSQRRRRKALGRISLERTSKLFDEPFYALNKHKRTSLQHLRLAYLAAHPEEFFRD
jgi:hypothetical protein